jgi:hypothetical protein
MGTHTMTGTPTAKYVAAERLASKMQHIRDCERDLHITMVMAWEDGMSLRAIAKQVGKSPETCRNIIGSVR